MTAKVLIERSNVLSEDSIRPCLEEGSIVIDKIHRPEKVDIRYRDGRVEHLTLPDDKPAMFYETEVRCSTRPSR